MKVSVHEARNRLGALLAEAEHGREITITRRGVAAGRLVPVGGGRSAAGQAIGASVSRSAVWPSATW